MVKIILSTEADDSDRKMRFYELERFVRDAKEKGVSATALMSVQTKGLAGHLKKITVESDQNPDATTTELREN